VIVMSFDERVHVLSPATSNRSVLRNAIMQTDFGNGTSLYEAVDVTLKRQLKQISGRKAVVLFTDGVDTTSRRAGYQSTLRDAEESEAMIYPIRYDTYNDMSPRYGGGGGGGGGNPNQYPYPRRRRSQQQPRITLGDILGGILSGSGGGIVLGGNYPQGGGGTMGGSREDYERGERYLEALAQNSGGRIFQASGTSNLEAAFSGIAEELRRQYTISYYPENAGEPGQRKQIRIRVNRPNAVVRSKNSYIVAGTPSTQNGQTPQRQQQQQQPAKKAPQIMNRLPF
jgi:Ca-activated chloride channel homolog